MAHHPNLRSFQDLPPRGGFPQINATKGIRPRGPSGWMIWAAVLGSSCYGFLSVSFANERRRMAKKEGRESRIAIFPYLQAEKDRELTEQVNASLAREAEIMKNTDGWVVGKSVYSKKWSFPTN